MAAESYNRLALSTLERFDKLTNLIYIVLRVMGISFYEKKQYNWRFLSCISVIVMGSSSVLYTLIFARHDLVMFLKCICASTQAIQGTSKLYVFTKILPALKGFSDFIRTLYVINCKATARRQTIMLEAVNNFQLLMKYILTVCILMILVVAAYPAYSFFCLDKVELFFEIQFIGYPMAAGTPTTYLINYTAQFLEIFYAYQGNIVFDVMLCKLCFHVYVMTELQRAAFDEAKEVISKDQKLFKQRFRNCIIMLQDINNYILKVKSTYSSMICVPISTGSVMMALSLFCVVKTDWLGAYAFALYAFIQIFVYCFIGTFVEITYDKLVDAIYDFPWYLTSTRDQKMIYLSLKKAQTAPKIMIGGIAALNVSSGAAIFKTIYPYLMMLLNFTD